MNKAGQRNRPHSPTSLLARLGSLKDLKNWHGLLPLAIFLVLAVPTGVYFMVSVPAMWAPDGGAHVARVFQIAEGGMRPVFINHDHGVGYGGRIPLNVAELKDVELSIIGRAGGAGAERSTKLITPQDRDVIRLLSQQKISKETTEISYVNTAAYSPAAYAPYVIGVKLGMVLNLGLGHTLLLARMLGLFTFIACTAYVLYGLRRSQLKWLIMTAALLPLVVFQCASITADSFAISVAILFSGIFLKGLTGNKLSIADTTLLYACVLLIPLVKSVYFPLIFLVLLLPKKQWTTATRYWIWMGSALILSLAGFGIWSAATADVAASNGLVRGDMMWQYGDAKIQEKFMLHHPFGYAHAIINSLIYQSKFYADTYFGWLGFTYLPIPGLAQVAGWLALGMSVLVAGKNKVRQYGPTAIWLALAAATFIIFTTFYITYTLPRNIVVEGIQGRYFQPLTVLLLAATAFSLPRLRIADSGQTTAKYVLVCLIGFCLLLSVLRYGLAIAT